MEKTLSIASLPHHPAYLVLTEINKIVYSSVLKQQIYVRGFHLNWGHFPCFLKVIEGGYGAEKGVGGEKDVHCQKMVR